MREKTSQPCFRFDQIPNLAVSYWIITMDTKAADTAKQFKRLSFHCFNSPHYILYTQRKTFFLIHLFSFALQVNT